MAILQLTNSNPTILLKPPSLDHSFFINKTTANFSYRNSQPRFVTRACLKQEPAAPSSLSRRSLITETLALTLLIGYQQPARSEDSPSLADWERVYLPIDPGVVLLDIAFVPEDVNHGFLLGTRQTLLETKDGGNTWVPRSIPSAEDEDFNYRFNSISFKGKEGWIVGKPSILLYTSDGGES